MFIGKRLFALAESKTINVTCNTNHRDFFLPF